ncbi:MAG TPA: hypothetical protein VM692_16265 [Gammaproteobacteria bacterium]|nr:hypothetical protein [Gammaproteobacteria bacterium]
MAAFAIRLARKFGAAILVLGACTATSAGAALDTGAFDAEQRQLLDRIDEIQSRDGAYSPALLDELKRLIVLYREREDHELALVVIERALQVVHANSGLYTLDQVPLMWQRLESEEARGNDEAAWDVEQELLTLARRHPDDLDAVPVLRAVADRQSAVLDRVVASNEIPPQVILGCYYEEWPNQYDRNCKAGSRTTVVQGMLADADRNYADAIAVLLRNEAYSSDELRELEMELVRGAQLIHEEYKDEGNRGVTGTRTRNPVPVPLTPWSTNAKTLEPWRSRLASIEELADWELPYASAGTPEEHFLQELEPRDARFRVPYYRGRQSLRRLYGYSVASATSPLDQASALVQIADWDLLFSSNGLAVEGYGLAREMLETANVDAASIAELFAPELPVVLPSFQPNPLLRDETLPARGHIDVAFAITKYGRARAIEIRGAANATDDDEAELESLLKNNRFRPRLKDGKLADTTPVVVRYYLHD